MAMTADGIKGERLGFLFQKRRGMKCLQPDLICKDYRNGSWFVVECKYKNRWKGKRDGIDWVGTGLDIKQVESRLLLQAETGMRCLLLTFDKESDHEAFISSREVTCYWAWLDELEASGDSFVCKGEGKGKFTKIYNIELMNQDTLVYNPSKLKLMMRNNEC